MQLRTQLARSGAGLALILGCSVIGCSDSTRPSADGAALGKCRTNGPPTNDVLVIDEWGNSLTRQSQPTQLRGVVTAAGRGAPPDTKIPDGWKQSETRWIVVEDLYHVWTIASRSLPDFAVRKGSTVSASYDSLTGQAWIPDRSILELRVGDTLAFYYGRTGGVDDLALPPEVEIKRGAATCKATNGCLAWDEYELEFSLNDSKPITLGTGESKVRGDYELKNFRSAKETEVHCADAFLADTTVLVARTSPLSEQPATDAGLEGDTSGLDAGVGIRCMLEAGECPGACSSIEGRTFDPAAQHPCLGDFQTLGCFPERSIVTEDDRCAKSPDGRIFGGISGTLVARLITESGYAECSKSEEEAWSALSLCKQP